MRILLLFLLLVVTHAANAGGTAVVTVGSDGSCDYTTILAASFNEPASDSLEIRVAKNYSLSSIQILSDRNTTVRGGYDTCSDNSASGKTVLDGNSFSGPIFVVENSISSSSRSSLSLLDLDISGGNASSDGGVLSLTGSWDLSVQNVSMQNNSSAQFGGAIAIKPATDPTVLTPQVRIYGLSILSNNSAVNGGAIACEDGGSVSIWNTQLAFNDADINGGAVFVNNGCKFYQYGGGLFQGIIFNDAGQSGGGISASDDSLIYINSNVFNAGPAVVMSNSASNGGGIFVSGESRLEALDATINNNTATITGGGIRSTAGHINIRRSSPGASCHKEVRCSTVSDNAVTGTESFGGGGAIATFGGTLEIKGTYIENNFASYGSAIRARYMPFSFDSNFTMVGNVIAGNRNAPQVVFLDESSAEIAFTTFVDNEDMDRVIEMAYPSTSADGHEVLISGSIFEHPGDTMPSAELTTAGPFPVGDCNRNELNSTGDLIGQPRSNTFVIAFEDRVGGDYRLQETSFPVDRCDSSFMGILSNVSANGFPRPVDNTVPDVNGPYDLGGLERYEMDVIFKDNF